MMKGHTLYWSGVAALCAGTILLSCSATPESTEHTSGASIDATNQLAYDGSSVCAFSGEPIETVRYGGRLTLVSGEILEFMSAECLAGYVLQMKNSESVERLEVTDFTHGKRLMDVEKMVFLHSRLRPSPNGMNLSAIEAADKKMRSYIYDAYPGPMLTWNEVLDLVREEWNLTAVSENTGGMQ
ncbi:MAG: hypothetical protein WEA36_03745 [Balneolaceae bacterium]